MSIFEEFCRLFHEEAVGVFSSRLPYVIDFLVGYTSHDVEFIDFNIRFR